MNRIIEYINHYSQLSDSSIKMLKEAVVHCSFKNKELIVRANVRNRYAYFISEGTTRSYWLHEGEEITTSFTSHVSIVFSMDELYYNLPSQEYVAAIGNVSAYKIRIEDLRNLVFKNLDLCNYFRIIHQDEYRRLHQCHRERLTLTAKQRYIAFRKQFPDIVRNVPLSYIASYLGITLSTLSRLRKAELDEI